MLLRSLLIAIVIVLYGTIYIASCNNWWELLLCLWARHPSMIWHTQTRLNRLKSRRPILASVPAWLKSDECDRSFVNVTHTFQTRDPLMINLKTMRTSTWIRQGNLTQTSLFSVISVWVCPHPAVSHVKVRLMMASLCASERRMMNSVSDCHHHNRPEVVSCSASPSVCSESDWRDFCSFKKWF